MADKFVNIYSQIPNLKDTRSSYCGYDKIRIETPFRMLVCGSSGSRKTNWVLNLVNKLKCFTKIYLFCRVLDEPLYAYLRAKMKKLMKKRKDPSLFFESNTLDNFPSFGTDEKTFNREDQNLVIIDDLMLDASQINPINAYIFGRKFNVSIIYINQSYFKLPITIRKNADIIVLKKINTKRDLIRILSEYEGATQFTTDELVKIYKSITDPNDAFVLDVNNVDPVYRVRINFKPVLKND